ncbi:metallophosphoesterase family protein [Sphingomonas humi]|uniref:Metallophosphoesterase family protein n=1 Tax=Sphingomonas humi TaxID=335630 RepID=A0ABP7S8P0_9SPHN
MFRRFFSSTRATAKGQPGWRAYVIGDVHGCLDLLDRLITEVADDHAVRGPARGLLVFLGDLIDRGPDSAGVLRRLRQFDLPGFRLVGLSGNHEEVLLKILAGDSTVVTDWLRFGGAETLASYGADPKALETISPEAAQRRIADIVPKADRHFLEGLADSMRFGDYFFVHAGIRPGIPHDHQSLRDLRWIREPFLTDSRDHGMVVVHGHTISEAVEEVGSRIGIDTGAYATGRLTALGIEGERRWLIDTVDGLQEKGADLV